MNSEDQAHAQKQEYDSRDGIVCYRLVSGMLQRCKDFGYRPETCRPVKSRCGGINSIISTKASETASSDAEDYVSLGSSGNIGDCPICSSFGGKVDSRELLATSQPQHLRLRGL